MSFNGVSLKQGFGVVKCQSSPLVEEALSLGCSLRSVDAGGSSVSSPLDSGSLGLPDYLGQPGARSLSSLVATCITQPIATLEAETLGGRVFHGRRACPRSVGWLRGRCEHGNERWVHIPCKRRDCPVCGEIRKRRISWRVEYGLEVLGSGAWIVVSWDYDVAKEDAVDTQNKLVRWFRSELGIRVEYAAVWENTKKHRLHLNLIVSPWRYIDQRVLSQKCVDFGAGPVVWIERVEGGIGAEVSKLNHKLGNYMAKFEQMVMTGRGINYSHGWPKPPGDPRDRIGRISWTWISPLYPDYDMFEQDCERGIWQEISPGEYSLCGEHELCDCFDYVGEACRSVLRAMRC